VHGGGRLPVGAHQGSALGAEGPCRRRHHRYVLADEDSIAEIGQRAPRDHVEGERERDAQLGGVIEPAPDHMVLADAVVQHDHSARQCVHRHSGGFPEQADPDRIDGEGDAFAKRERVEHQLRCTPRGQCLGIAAGQFCELGERESVDGQLRENTSCHSKSVDRDAAAESSVLIEKRGQPAVGPVLVRCGVENPARVGERRGLDLGLLRCDALLVDERGLGGQSLDQSETTIGGVRKPAVKFPQVQATRLRTAVKFGGRLVYRAEQTP